MATTVATDLDHWTLDEWLEQVWRLYGHNDRIRAVSSIWSSLGIYVSNIAEGLRKAHYDEVFEGLAHTFVWLTSFVAKCTKDTALPSIYRLDEERLSDIIALKFPNRCSHCYASPCACSSMRSQLEAMSDKKGAPEGVMLTRRVAFQNSCGYRNWAIDQWIQMFQDIFENSYMPLPLENIGFHLAEEVGEVAHAIRALSHLEGREDDAAQQEIEEQKLELKKEIADCMSWIAAVFLRTRAILLSAPGEAGYITILNPPEFSTILRKRFAPQGRFGCPRCEHNNRCTCEIAIVKYIPEPPNRE